MTNSVLILAALIGTTLIVVRGTIFARVQRFWPALFQCAQCTGFWVGVIAVASKIVTLGYSKPIDAIVVGTATSFLAMAADAVLVSLLGDPKE